MKHQTPEEKQARLEAAREFQKKNYRIPYITEDMMDTHVDTHGEFGGYSIRQAAFEEMTGIILNPKVWEISPIGQRIIVALSPKADRYGAVILPDTSSADMNNHGWVISVGTTCNTETQIPGGPAITHPAELLGLHWYFDLSGGRVLQLGISDSTFDAPLRVLTIRDLWIVDSAPWNDPWDLERGDE
jgi:hypothetical protein